MGMIAASGVSHSAINLKIREALLSLSFAVE